jgi:UDP-2,3-diacylglucosamine pyrophosphatase LpxH
MKKIIKDFLEKYKFVRGDINLNSRAGALHKCWGHIFSNHLFGDYVEFGVYHGDSFLESINQFEQFKKWLENQKNSSEKWRVEIATNSPLNQTVYFHGLDTFEGMPKNDEKNFTFQEKSFLSSYEKVQDRIQKVNFKNFFLYKGKFNESENEILVIFTVQQLIVLK